MPAFKAALKALGLELGHWSPHDCEYWCCEFRKLTESPRALHEQRSFLFATFLVAILKAASGRAFVNPSQAFTFPHGLSHRGRKRGCRNFYFVWKRCGRGVGSAMLASGASRWSWIAGLFRDKP